MAPTADTIARAATPVGPTPGLIFTNSGISRPDELTPEAYNSFYTETHIPDALATNGFAGASYYVNIDPKAKKPFLVLFRLPDLGLTASKEFQDIKVNYKNEGLPGSGLMFDYADFDIRNYKEVQVYNPKGVELGHAPYLMASAIEPSDSVTAEEVDEWYRKEHLQLLNKVPSYVGTTRAALTGAITNAEGRASKGEPVTKREEEMAKTARKPPVLMSLHEFKSLEALQEGSAEAKKVPEAAVTEWAEKIIGGVTMEVSLYKLVKHW